MTPDPKLVEAVARAYARWSDRSDVNYQDYLPGIAAALAAISAGGEWWIAPWEATSKMETAADELECSVSYFDWIVMWVAMRDAHLKDTGTDDAPEEKG